MRFWVRVSALSLTALLLLASCATGKGSGFARETSRERSAHTDSSKDKDKNKSDDSGDSNNSDFEMPVTPTLTIDATPSDARISVNGRFIGRGTASINSGGFGQQVVIVVEAPAYYPQTLNVSLWNQTDTINVDLRPVVGTLQLLGDLADAQLLIPQWPIHAGSNTVQIGTYEMLVRRFGYQDQRLPVTVRENETTTLDIAFVAAPFRLSGLTSDKPDGFNPDSASIAAKTRILFQASGPGHALLVLSDLKGVERGRWAFDHLTTWSQEATWDGKKRGAALPDGNYTVSLTGGSEPGTDTEKLTTRVRIDRSLIDRDRPSLGPAAGLLWAPTAEVLSPGTLQTSVLALGHVEDWMGQFPVSTAIRLAPAHGWELYLQGSFRLWTDPDLDSGYATFSVKRRIAIDSPNFRLAWVAGGTLGSWLTGDPGIPPTDYLTTFPALKALLPASWSLGKWTILVAPEIDGSFWSPSTAYTESSGPETGFRLWGYARVGISYDAGTFSAAISGAARSQSFDRGTGWLAPAHLALEGHYPVPETPLTLSGYLSVSAYSTVDYAWYGGLGISLLLPASMTPDMGSLF